MQPTSQTLPSAAPAGLHRWIWVVSIAVPVLVGVLLSIKPVVIPGVDVRWLPRLNAYLNSSVAVLLVAAYVLIRRKRVRAHQQAMWAAFGLSAVFLVSYVVYHAFTEETRFPKTDPNRTAYLILLFSHIAVSVAIVPLVLITLYRGQTMQVARHRRIAKWTLPLWLYVAVTGVAVYLMISPHYPK
jgi:putative membrane protein